MKYYVNYHTGAGNFEVEGELFEVMEAEDKDATYPQDSISIEEDGIVVARRPWYGCMSGVEEEENPIQFGTSGFYGDWVVEQ